jgi:hypothetical protein
MLRGKSGLGTRSTYAAHLTEPDKHYTVNRTVPRYDTTEDSGQGSVEEHI